LTNFKGGRDLKGHKTAHTSQLARLSRVEGQVRGIKKMVEDERYCVDILTQLRSVMGALQKVQENIFQHHIESCVHDSLHSDDMADKEAKVEEILKLVSQFRNY
jgi:DNA-binding FrmR family transcriptional regulator